jgi:predicted ATPase
LLPRLPAGAAHDIQELDLQMGLSWSLALAIGLRAPERESALVRARELCEQLGDDAKLMEALLALAHFRFNRRDFELARELAERVLAMAQQFKTPAMLAGANALLGFVRFSTGQFAAAREHFERAVELFGARPSGDHGARILIIQEAPNVLVVLLVVLGYPSTALNRAHELQAVARQCADPNSIARTLFSEGLHHVLLHDTRMVAERADEMLSIVTEQEIPIGLIAATFLRGWATAAAGRSEEGIAEMRRSISHPMVPDTLVGALMLVALAETCGKNGRAEEGLDLVAKGLGTAEQTGQRVVEAELHRLRGDLLMATDLGRVAEAQRCLRTAIDIARQQGARLFELRAAVSLARLLKQQGKTDEARQMLAEIYGWFTEGFDTADLKEAKAVLVELGGKK